MYHHGLVAAEIKINEELLTQDLNVEEANFLKSRFQLAKAKTLKAVRALVSHCLLEKGGSQELEKWLDIHNGFLSDITFFVDYTKSFPIDEDMDLFRLQGVTIDTMRIEYLKDGLYNYKQTNKPPRPSNHLDLPQKAEVTQDVTTSLRGAAAQIEK